MFGHVGAHHLGGDDEVVLLAAVDQHRLAAGHANHLRIAQPAGRGDEHLVAGIENRAQRGEQRLLGAAGDNNFSGRVFNAIIVVKFITDLLAQIQRACDGSITGNARVDGKLACIVDVFRRAEIGFAGGKADDVHSLRAQLLGARVNRKGNRRRNGQRAFGKRKRHVENVLSTGNSRKNCSEFILFKERVEFPHDEGFFWLNLHDEVGILAKSCL